MFNSILTILLLRVHTKTHTDTTISISLFPIYRTYLFYTYQFVQTSEKKTRKENVKQVFIIISTQQTKLHYILTSPKKRIVSAHRNIFIHNQQIQNTHTNIHTTSTFILNEQRSNSHPMEEKLYQQQTVIVNV